VGRGQAHVSDSQLREVHPQRVGGYRRGQSGPESLGPACPEGMCAGRPRGCGGVFQVEDAGALVRGPTTSSGRWLHPGRRLLGRRAWSRALSSGALPSGLQLTRPRVNLQSEAARRSEGGKQWAGEEIGGEEGRQQVETGLWRSLAVPQSPAGRGCRSAAGK